MTVATENQLERLLESRYHGATNIAGIRYQLVYSVLRAMDLLRENGPESIRLEGLEDLDVHGHREVDHFGIRLPREYVQVKTSKKAWDWGRFAGSNIVKNFLEVWVTDPSVRLLVATSFGYRDRLDELAKFCSGSRGSLSPGTRRDLVGVCRRAGYPNVDVDGFIRCLRFERISEDDLQQRVEQAVIRAFSLAQPIADLYSLVLIARFLQGAAKRESWQASDLQALRLSIEEALAMGPVNPAVQQGWIEPLRFAPEEHPEDYYEGKNARPAHILAGLDVRRPIWEERIHEALNRSRLCIIRASSGQGKSTLLYRYAYEHFHPETALLIRVMNDESMVGPIAQVIESRLKLGLPVLVFIDNVGPVLRAWPQLMARFSGGPVMCLLTMREEDWYRYSPGAGGPSPELVTPDLSLVEAKRIYAAFRDKGRLAPGITSAEWAYEQVADQKLLIEFTYLLTHGQMLVDRLRDQVMAFERLGEDPAKSQVLRLVSVAQAYGARVPLAKLLREVIFTGDPDATLASLEREYMLFRDEECEGLHLVRSRHLVPLLHCVLPVETTMSQLIRILDDNNLESFIYNAFADDSLDKTVLMNALIERSSHEPLGFANRVAAALFRASEEYYYRQNKRCFDSAHQEIGSAGVSMLCWATLPVKVNDGWETLTKDLGSKFANLTFLDGLATQFVARAVAPRFEGQYLRARVKRFSEEDLADFAAIAGFLGWCRFAEIDMSPFVTALATHDWRMQIYRSDAEHVADFLDALNQLAPVNYQQLLGTDKDRLVEYYKLASDTLLVTEGSDSLYIEFVVDETSGSRKPHDQALSRLRILAGMFPSYERYRSLGLYPSTFGVGRPVDDTHKEITREWLRMEDTAARNHAYIEIVETHYCADSIYEWQQQWYELRRELLDLVTRMHHFYRELYRPATPDVEALNTLIRRCLAGLQLAKGLPASHAQRFEQIQRSVSEWESEMANFIRQFVENGLRHGPSHLSNLMRINLRDAFKHLPAMQAGVMSIVAGTQSYFDFAGLAEQERERYRRLIDLLDFAAEGPNQPTQNLDRSVTEFRQDKNRRFIDSVRVCLVPLEREGLRFVYPTELVIDSALVGLVLGFEIEDFSLLIEHMAAIMIHLAALQEECHWIYFVPLLQGQLCMPEIRRISFQKAREIADGKMDDVRWALLPLEPTADVLGVLPGIETRIPMELDTISRLLQIRFSLNMARNLRHIVDTRLDRSKPVESELAERYDEKIAALSAPAAQEWERVFAEMYGMAANNPANTEWDAFCLACAQRIAVYFDSPVDEGGVFVPIDVLHDPDLDKVLGHYLTARYIPRDK